MKNDLISIGKMAEISRLTVPALRFYDRLDLLKPAWTDPETGYRYYHVGQNARLDMISYMKELGMSLSEIADILNREDIDLIEALLIEKNEQLYRQMRELKSRREAVERAISSIEHYRKAPMTGMIALEFIDRRRIWGIPCSYDFYDTDAAADNYEYLLTELREKLFKEGVEKVYTYNVGTSIAAEDFIALNFKAKDIFIFADDHFALKTDTTLIGSGMYACIYLDDFNNETDGARRLLDYCNKNSYIINGDYICEVMTEFNIFDRTHRNMYMRLQVPIKFG